LHFEFELAVIGKVLTGDRHDVQMPHQLNRNTSAKPDSGNKKYFLPLCRVLPWDFDFPQDSTPHLPSQTG
jgi:hypothetical protein